jgi:hypothetical protein
MVKAIERLEQDIAGLKQAIGAIAAELQNAYANYLSILGQAVKKQLILASYHLCTQGYPENFLNLSLTRRQNLQQFIRSIGEHTAGQLLDLLQDQETESPSSTTTEEVEEEVEVSEEVAEDSESTGEEKPENQKLKTLDPNNPVEVLQWQQELEAAVGQILRECTQDTNIILQKAGVLPKKLPEAVLAAALAASESAGEVVPSPPNLLNLVIQVSHEQEMEDAKVTQIMTINLRLGEIEFADANLVSGRKQIRNILAQLHGLGRDFQKKHRELKVAEAEAAWRASWFE